MSSQIHSPSHVIASKVGITSFQFQAILSQISEINGVS